MLDPSALTVFLPCIKATVEGRLEAFNLTNRLNAATINTTYGIDATTPVPTFLTVTAAQPQRQFQVAARVTF